MKTNEIRFITHTKRLIRETGMSISEKTIEFVISYLYNKGFVSESELRILFYTFGIRCTCFKNFKTYEDETTLSKKGICLMIGNNMTEEEVDETIENSIKKIRACYQILYRLINENDTPNRIKQSCEENLQN